MQGKGKVTDCHPRPSPLIIAYFCPSSPIPYKKNKNMAVHKKYNRNAKTNALGRGLDALISTESVSTQGSSTINEVALDQIEANPNQPRREFDPVALEALANSIRELGLGPSRPARPMRTVSRSLPVTVAGVPASWPV